MTTDKLARALGLEIFVSGEDREVGSGFCGDLLSWVMGSAKEGCAWITVMSNANVAAVALLCGAACVILAGGARPDEALEKRARAEGISLFCSEKDAFALCVELGGLLGA